MTYEPPTNSETGGHREAAQGPGPRNVPFSETGGCLLSDCPSRNVDEV